MASHSQTMRAYLPCHGVGVAQHGYFVFVEHLRGTAGNILTSVMQIVNVFCLVRPLNWQLVADNSSFYSSF